MFAVIWEMRAEFLMTNSSSSKKALRVVSTFGHVENLRRVLLQLPDVDLHLLGRLLGPFGQFAHLVGDDGEAPAVLPGPGGLDGGVEGQKVGLVADVLDEADDGADGVDAFVKGVGASLERGALLPDLLDALDHPFTLFADPVDPHGGSAVEIRRLFQRLDVGFHDFP